MGYPKRRATDALVTGDFCRRFGAIAVHKGFVKADEVKAALAEQVDDNVEGREHRLLGTILFERGWITEQRIELVLAQLRDALLKTGP